MGDDLQREISVGVADQLRLTGAILRDAGDMIQSPGRRAAVVGLTLAITAVYRRYGWGTSFVRSYSAHGTAAVLMPEAFELAARAAEGIAGMIDPGESAVEATLAEH